VASYIGLLEITPIESPCSSAYSRIVFNAAPSSSPCGGISDKTPFLAFVPVTIAVIPAAESVIQSG
jgi:hypothetical protein